MWIALVVKYAKQELGEQALECYKQMLHVGVDKGKQIHEKLKDLRLLEDTILVGSTVVDMYYKLACYNKAMQIFNKFPIRDAVAWIA